MVSRSSWTSRGRAAAVSPRRFSGAQATLDWGFMAKTLTAVFRGSEDHRWTVTCMPGIRPASPWAMPMAEDAVAPLTVTRYECVPR